MKVRIRFRRGVEVFKGGSVYPYYALSAVSGGRACGTIFFADPKEKLLAICFTQK